MRCSSLCSSMPTTVLRNLFAFFFCPDSGMACDGPRPAAAAWSETDVGKITTATSPGAPLRSAAPCRCYRGAGHRSRPFARRSAHWRGRLCLCLSVAMFAGRPAACLRLAFGLPCPTPDPTVAITLFRAASSRGRAAALASYMPPGLAQARGASAGKGQDAPRPRPGQPRLALAPPWLRLVRIVLRPGLAPPPGSGSADVGRGGVAWRPLAPMNVTKGPGRGPGGWRPGVPRDAPCGRPARTARMRGGTAYPQLRRLTPGQR